MIRRSIVFALAAAALTIAAHAQAPHLDRVEPFRLKTQGSGWVRIDVYGTFPSFTTGHPDLDQYEHWYVTRDGRPWQLCRRTDSSCRMTGFTGDSMSLELNAAEWLKTPGFVDIRMNEGLSADGHIDTPFSNAVRVPVLAAFGAPPVIVSTSKTQFVSGAPENDFVFRIGANNFDPGSVVVVFRGDELVHPRRVYDGNTIEVAVPPKYRNANGELSFRLRTDSGGYSEPKYFKVLKASAPSPKVMGNVARTMPNAAASPNASGGARISPDVMLAMRVRDAIIGKIGLEAAKGITINAKGDVVTLSGSVATDEQRRAATAAASGVSGVMQVSSSVVVK